MHAFNPIEQGVMFQPHQAAEFGSFDHIVSDLELNIERGYGIFLGD